MVLEPFLILVPFVIIRTFLIYIYIYIYVRVLIGFIPPHPLPPTKRENREIAWLGNIFCSTKCGGGLRVTYSVSFL
jgi:hypothetical protein